MNDTLIILSSSYGDIYNIKPWLSGGDPVKADSLGVGNNQKIKLIQTNTGSKVGGTNVVITGANFTSVTNVKFGGTNAASFSIINSTQINAVTPAYITTGIVDVAAISTFGTGTDHGGFTYT